MRLGSGQKGGTFIDLIKRVRADHQAVIATIDYCLGEGEQRFACAIDRQYIARRINPALWYAESTVAPAGNGFAQRRDTQRGRVNRHLIEVVCECLGDEIG